MGDSEAAMAAVLRDDDLLREILLRLDFPAFLVRAALVSKRWLGLAAEPAFLLRFHDRHPPRLLGIYIYDTCSLEQEFVPVTEAPELRTAVSRAGFDDSDPAAEPFDCRHGRLLLHTGEFTHGQFLVRSPLCPTLSMVAISPPPPQLPGVPHRLLPFIRRACFLSRDNSGGIVFVYLLLRSQMLSVRVYVLHSGDWGEGILAQGQLPPQLSSVWMVMAAHGKLYMLTDNRAYIHGLDFLAPCPEFFTVKLPDEVGSENYKLSSGDDDGILIIHGEGFQLSVWRHETTDDDGEDSWELVDRFRVSTAQDRREKIVVVGVGDNAELVFLGLQASRAIICVNLRTREEIMVHEIPKRRFVGYITVFPFMTVWPPVFPALNDEDDYVE